jgi:hypothetical protein
MHGLGVFKWPNGQVRYEGYWNQGRRHGLGKMITSFGRVRDSGVWKQG